MNSVVSAEHLGVRNFGTGRADGARVTSPPDRTLDTDAYGESWPLIIPNGAPGDLEDSKYT